MSGVEQGALAESRSSRSGRASRRLGELLLGRVFTLILAVVALVMGIATFAVLSGGMQLGTRSDSVVYGLVIANLVVLLPLGLVLVVRLVRVWVERRRGSAGSRLHVRLVVLFGVVAVTPAIVVAVFATFFFNLGIQTWFNDRVRTALHESLQASQGYLEEHRNHIRADAVGLSDYLIRAMEELRSDPNTFGQVLYEQTVARGLAEAVMYEPTTSQVIVSTGAMGGFGADPPPPWAVSVAKSGEVAVFGEETKRVRALVQMDTKPPLMLLISRPVDVQILEHMSRTEESVAEYDRLDENRTGLQITFVLIFAVVALLVLSAAVLIGLLLANQIARPIGRLIFAAERVRAGDLATRVPESAGDDEVADLSRAFNRMTGQLSAQRGELMDAYGQIDQRRRFTEAVLSGVSAGVIGLDRQGAIELPNRAASSLLGIDLLACVGQKLVELVPEFGPLIAAALASPHVAHTAELEIGSASARRILLVRIGADRPEQDPAHDGVDGVTVEARGFVATFDDITQLQAAQRKAAWADVARRIAHEIKNPLTPIQLSAERLKRRFAREITSDPETFIQCADTIVRSVGDIGRMVDEFSAFARMPLPVIKPTDLSRVVREAMVLQRQAHPEIVWDVSLPDKGPMVLCDGRLVGQALTNLLQNAADAVAMREDQAAAGRIGVSIHRAGEDLCISVADNGVGLPQEDRGRLAEPYVTHKPKGTGLGLAIVKKIMEDHGGRIMLEDNASGIGAVASLCLPAPPLAEGGANEPGNLSLSRTGERGDHASGDIDGL
jgi:two-component system nitrogen regulation sensor histidine kinase NtrY